MAIYSLQRLRMGATVEDAALTQHEAAALAEQLEWAQQRERVRYDHQAEGLRRFGVDPAEVLGPRP